MTNPILYRLLTKIGNLCIYKGEDYSCIEDGTIRYILSFALDHVWNPYLIPRQSEIPLRQLHLSLLQENVANQLFDGHILLKTTERNLIDRVKNVLRRDLLPQMSPPFYERTESTWWGKEE